VIGAFDDRRSAERAVEKLVKAGCDRGDVHIEPADGGAMQTGSAATTPSDASRVDEDRGVMASIGHFFASLFGEDDDSRRHVNRYSEAVHRGNAVVVVDAANDEEAEHAATLLHEAGAIDVDERAEQWRSQGWDESEAGNRYLGSAPGNTQGFAPQGTAFDATPGTAQTGQRTGKLTGEQKLDVVQEELSVAKRMVQRGGVRVVQRLSEKPVRELVRLREERAVIDRQPVDRQATAADLSNFREGTLEVRETAEEPVVQKTARVVEEVRVGKDVREREQTIEDTVRRKDVEVQRLPGEGMSRTEIERERAMAADNNGSQELDAVRDRDLMESERRTMGDRAAMSDRGTMTDRERDTLAGGKPRKNP
jgi:uncharacterized protein (TIGR02271 family)